MSTTSSTRGEASAAPLPDHGVVPAVWSRITSLDGLYLTRPLRPSDIMVDPDVERFMRDARSMRVPVASE